MDGLGIENAISQANSLTSQAENARAAQSTLIRSIGIQNQKDKNAATDKIASDRNSFLAMDGFHGAETAWNLYNESGQTLKDFSDSTDTADFLGRQLKRSLAGDVGRGIDNVANNWISGKMNTFGSAAAPSTTLPLSEAAQDRSRFAAAKEAGRVATAAKQEAEAKAARLQAGADFRNRPQFGPATAADARIAEQNQSMAFNEFNNVGEAAEAPVVRVGRANRVAGALGSSAADVTTGDDLVVDPGVIRTQLTTDIQDTAAVNARNLSNRPLGQQLNFKNTTSQGANNVEDLVPPSATNAPTTTPTGTTPAADTPSSGTTTTTTPADDAPSGSAPPVPEDEGAGGKALAFFKKGQALAGNPVVRGGMKVIGNIQGGEDIYDLFENRNKFDDGSDGNKSAAGFHEGAHILSSLGTVADVAGIFLPGAEELGAALNLTGSILDSVGDHEKDVSNASTVFTNASNALTAASKPITTSPALQSAGLIAGSATHQGASAGVSTF